MNTLISEPGIYPDLSFADYLADPVIGGSLTSSGIKTLVKATPARFAHERANGRPESDAFDLGHAAHAEILGVGYPMAILSADMLGSDGSASTKAAKEFIAAARARGDVPVKQHTADQVLAMADQVRAHPIAGPMLAPGSGIPEATVMAVDPDSGVRLRARYDWWTEEPPLIVDYKTATSAHPNDFRKAVYTYGYYTQNAVYSHVARLLGHLEVVFRFVVQETAPPYLVNVIELDILAQRAGEMDMREGMQTYRACVESGEWPGYPEDVTLLSLPAWAEREYGLDLLTGSDL